MNSKLTLNYGVRFEHEDGLREDREPQTVGFDQAATNPIDALVPKAGTALAGRTLRGGLIFRRCRRRARRARRPTGDQSGAARRCHLRAQPRHGAPRRLRHFYAPWQYNATNHGQIGFARTTALNQSSAESDVPITTLDNPFPGGLQQPIGSSLGLLTGVGGDINYIDQDKGAPIVHQYSFDLQRELAGEMAVTIGYMGATGRDLGFAGTNNVGLNINQIDPELARQMFPAPGGGWNAAALRQSVRNPFFGIAQAGELGTRADGAARAAAAAIPTVRRRHRVRADRRRQAAVPRRHAGARQAPDRRWWGGRYSYTWSRLEDNQFGEDSAYQTRTATPQNVYDLDAEYGISNFDSPHRIVLAPIVRFPEPVAARAAARRLDGVARSSSS